MPQHFLGRNTFCFAAFAHCFRECHSPETLYYSDWLFSRRTNSYKG
jgi:hypothetical protein